jgi:hypothetical protein
MCRQIGMIGLTLATGSHPSGVRGALVTLAQLRAIDPSDFDLGPYGHNVHVENPGQLFRSVGCLSGK